MDKVVKLKRFRRTFENPPVSEERSLELQAETYRLKRELQNKDVQHKLLTVQLHRAQEAAKKNLRAAVEQGLQTSRDKNAVMAMFLQQNNAEERIHELELKLREGHKDTQKYLEFSRQAKAEAESLKKRLEVSVRASRRTRAPTPLDVSRRYEKMVKKLKNQISTLTEENRELHSLQSDGSKASTSARLEVVSHVVGPPDSQTKLQQQPGVQAVQDSSGPSQVTTQLMKTCEDLDKLKKKYDITTEELRQLKINHSKCLQKLQDTYSELTQERKVRQELEIEKKHISGELVAVQHLKSNLQQLRQQNVQLENENAELLNAALNVPRTNFAEIKGLREQLVEELKQRNLAVASAAKLTTQLEDCKRDLARLAVVEANWQYLKKEVEVANKSVATGNLKVAELQAANKLLQKQVNELQLRRVEIPEELDVIYET